LGTSKAADYSILVVVYLASLPQGTIKSKAELAQVLRLPSDFLSKLLQKLTHVHIIRSIKGIKGGYALQRAPEEITLRQVIEAIDGPFRLVECLGEDGTVCIRSDLCYNISRKLRTVQNNINAVMEQVHFGEMAGNIL